MVAAKIFVYFDASFLPKKPLKMSNGRLYVLSVIITGADLGKKLRGDLYAGLYSKIGSI